LNFDILVEERPITASTTSLEKWKLRDKSEQQSTVSGSLVHD
jgi:hypothetical protein